MATNGFEVKGLRELGAALKELDQDIQKKIARAAVGAGLRVVKLAAIEKAPVADAPYVATGREGVKSGGGRKGRFKGKTLVDGGVVVQPGNIGKNIIQKRLPPSPGKESGIVAVRGKKKYGFASRIGALQEFGTVNQRPQPYMRPAFDENLEKAANAIKDRLLKRIEKAQRTGK